LKILKLIKHKYDRYSAVFDEIPALTYEKIGSDYVGSAVNSNGDIVASHWLKKERYGDAFGGRELELEMKDGSVEKIKDYWFDYGSYPEHGEFMSIGAETLEGLQRCYVYFGYYINAVTFQKMVDEYLKFEKVYGYWEVEDWCKLQYKWHDVIVNGKKIPYMMNYRGEMVEKESKKPVYARENVIKTMHGSFREYHFFKFEYKQNGKMIKIHANYLETLKSTLPYTEEEIRKNCNLPSIKDDEETKRKFRLLRMIGELNKTERRMIFQRLKKEFGQLESEVI